MKNNNRSKCELYELVRIVYKYNSFIILEVEAQIHPATTSMEYVPACSYMVLLVNVTEALTNSAGE